MVKTRYTIVETSDTSYTLKWEMQGQDGRWMTVMERLFPSRWPALTTPVHQQENKEKKFLCNHMTLL